MDPYPPPHGPFPEVIAHPKGAAKPLFSLIVKSRSMTQEAPPAGVQRLVGIVLPLLPPMGLFSKCFLNQCSGLCSSPVDSAWRKMCAFRAAGRATGTWRRAIAACRAQPSKLSLIQREWGREQGRRGAINHLRPPGRGARLGAGHPSTNPPISPTHPPPLYHQPLQPLSFRPQKGNIDRLQRTHPE